MQARKRLLPREIPIVWGGSVCYNRFKDILLIGAAMIELETCCGCKNKIKQNEVHTYSAISGSNDNHVLCPKCAKLEEEDIDTAGTNYLPKLLEEYTQNNN